MYGVSLWICCSSAQTQSLRDPTLPPAEAVPTSNAAGDQTGSPALTGMTIVVRQGQPFLASRSRLYARGQKMGQVRIERISETEIWLRERDVLRKVPLFTGIQRHVAASQKLAPIPPCTDLQSNCLQP